jgi:hypothetical protein
MGLRASTRLGARIEWYGQRRRNPDKRRNGQQAKDADRLAQKGMEPVQEVFVLLSCTQRLPAKRDGPNPLWHWDETWQAHISPGIGKATRKGSRWRCGYRNVEKAKAPL